MTSCRKKKSEEATFLEVVKDQIDEFIHASMDEHKTCFTKTIQKMFGMSKVVAERAAEGKEAEVESAFAASDQCFTVEFNGVRLSVVASVCSFCYGIDLPSLQEMLSSGCVQISNGKKYALSDVIDAIKHAFGGSPQIECKKGSAQWKKSGYALTNI